MEATYYDNAVQGPAQPSTYQASTDTRNPGEVSIYWGVQQLSNSCGLLPEYNQTHRQKGSIALPYPQIPILDTGYGYEHGLTFTAPGQTTQIGSSSNLTHHSVQTRLPLQNQQHLEQHAYTCEEGPRDMLTNCHEKTPPFVVSQLGNGECFPIGFTASDSSHQWTHNQEQESPLMGPWSSSLQHSSRTNNHYYHHHRHPPSRHRSLMNQRIGRDDDVTTVEGYGSSSVVGQPGMPEPAAQPRGPKLRITPEDDALLVTLKETKDLSWKQIADFFPGRSSGTLQVRYCTKLKPKPATRPTCTWCRLRTGHWQQLAEPTDLKSRCAFSQSPPSST